jgi:hypothetical protein
MENIFQNFFLKKNNVKLLNTISFFLLLFILFKIIYEIRFFFQFHPPSTFLFIRFVPILFIAICFI